MTPARDLAWVMTLVESQQAPAHLRAYFAEGTAESSTFSGRHFEALDGGGDRHPVSGQITAADLVAVQMLSVTVPRVAAAELLFGETGRRGNEQLALIPVGVSIDTPQSSDLLTKGAPASEAWDLLERQPGIGWVTAGKLLARKRPALIPVYDDVVKKATKAPTGQAWCWFRSMFEASDGQLSEALTRVAAEAAVPQQVTPLRILDVLLWMRHPPKDYA